MIRQASKPRLFLRVMPDDSLPLVPQDWTLFSESERPILDIRVIIRQEWRTYLSKHGSEEPDGTIAVWQIIECLLAFSGFSSIRFQHQPCCPALHYNFDDFALEVSPSACLQKFAGMSCEQRRREAISFELDRLLRLHLINELVKAHPTLKSVLLEIWRALPAGYQKASQIISQKSWDLLPPITRSQEIMYGMEWVRQCWQVKATSRISEQVSSYSGVSELTSKFVTALKTVIAHKNSSLSENVLSSLECLFLLGNDKLLKAGFDCLVSGDLDYSFLSRETLLNSDGSIKSFNQEERSEAIVDLALPPSWMRNGPELTFPTVGQVPWDERSARTIVRDFICCDVDHPGAVVDARVLPNSKTVIQHALRVLFRLNYQAGILSGVESEVILLEKRMEFFSYLQFRLNEYLELDEQEKQIAEEIGRAAKSRRALSYSECRFILEVQAKNSR